MALEKEAVWAKLNERFGDMISPDTNSIDELSVIIDKSQSFELIRFLKNDELLRFHFLTDVCGAHFPENELSKQFCVIYHLHNWIDNFRIRVKVFADGNQPKVDSIVSIFEAANWQERETYDFYGIEFNNHPDLRRILNMDEMVSFPMRKEFPMEDMNRTDKDDRYFGRIPQNSLN